MAMKKKTVRRKVTQWKRESISGMGRLKQVVDPKADEQRIRKTWNDTVEALSAAEARVEKEIRGLLARNRISTRDAAIAIKGASKRIDDAVLAALATFNIPSRHEVNELTRKVNELSKKVDSLKRR